MKFDFTEWARENLVGVKNSSNGEITAECPFCGKFGGFYLNTETGAHICFKGSCEAKGRTIIPVVAEVEGISLAEAARRVFREAVKFRPQRSGTSPTDLLKRLREMRGVDEDEHEGAAVDQGLPPNCVPIYDGKRWLVPKYLKQRGVTKEAMAHFGMAIARSGAAIRSEGRRRPLDFSGRIILPFECPNGRSFTARATRPDQQPKYLNPEGSGKAFEALLYGWQNVIPGGELVIVEGPFDAVRLWQHGIAAVALLGKYMSAAKLAMIASVRPSAVTLMFDSDGPGMAAAMSVGAALYPVVPRLLVATLPEGVDPGDTDAEQAWSAYTRATPFTGDRSAKIAALRKRMLRKK